MRVAALYDIHGNLPALQVVLREIRHSDVDQVVVGGDVLPGPMPRETLAHLSDFEIPVLFIHGNGDREVLARMAHTETDWYRSAPEQWRAPIKWTAEQLDPEHQRLLASWPPMIRVAVEGLGTVLFCHATPRNDTDCFTCLTPDEVLAPIFKQVSEPVIVCGHTHMQFERRIGALRVVNAGSIGMPFGEAGADWLVLGPDVEFRHTAYDLTKAADLFRQTTYPQAEEFAENYVLHPPSEEHMLEVFGRADFK